MANSTGNPVCKLCGSAHRLSERHVWSGSAASSKPVSTSSGSKIPATKKTSGTGARARSLGRPTSSTAAGTSAPNVKSRKATRSSSLKERKTKSRARKVSTTARTSEEFIVDRPISVKPLPFAITEAVFDEEGGESAAPVAMESVAEVGQPGFASLTEVLAKPKTDRKEYLKLKARERRACERAAKDGQ